MLRQSLASSFAVLVAMHSKPGYKIDFSQKVLSG